MRSRWWIAACCSVAFAWGFWGDRSTFLPIVSHPAERSTPCQPIGVSYQRAERAEQQNFSIAGVFTGVAGVPSDDDALLAQIVDRDGNLPASASLIGEYELAAVDLPFIPIGSDLHLSIDRFAQHHASPVLAVRPATPGDPVTAMVRTSTFNESGDLHVGQAVDAAVTVDMGERTWRIPLTAPIFSGESAFVYVPVEGTSRYLLREVRLGAPSRNGYPVRLGLQPREQVVTFGALALDDSRELPQVLSRCNARQEAAPLPLTGQDASAIARLMSHYTGMQTALAGDDLQALHAAATGMLASLDNTNPSDLGLRIFLTESAAELRARAVYLQTASQLTHARNAFAGLSLLFIKLVAAFGPGGKDTWSLVHCPMAFSGAGAQWLQPAGAIANPYYGQSMLRCGEVRTTIAGVAP